MQIATKVNVRAGASGGAEDGWGALQADATIYREIYVGEKTFL